MTQTEHVDEENPPLSNTKFLIFKDPEPGFTQSAISVAMNIIFSNMVVYGVTGNIRMGILASMATVPCSVIMGIKDMKEDYEKWKETKGMRAKGLPDRFLPYKCKYDWTEWEKREAAS